MKHKPIKLYEGVLLFETHPILGFSYSFIDVKINNKSKYNENKNRKQNL